MFLQEYLQKFFCLIFRHSPPASQHTWSTCPQDCGSRLEKSFLAWPLTNFAPPPLPCRHTQTSGPPNVLSKVQTSESPMAPSPDWCFFQHHKFQST